MRINWRREERQSVYKSSSAILVFLVQTNVQTAVLVFNDKYNKTEPEIKFIYHHQQQKQQHHKFIYQDQD